MSKKLFIPGPVVVKQDVLDKMSTPMISHRGKEASYLQFEISNKLKKIFNTNNEILLSTTSGSGLMEGAIRSCTKKRAAVFSIGAFGQRWFEMAISNNVPADLFKYDWGKAIDIQEIDKNLSTGKYDSIYITHNETSTGVMNPIVDISMIMKKYPEIIWCLDTVSSMGGTNIDVDKLGIDVCITSTQKALALPPGMAICSISEKAINQARKVSFRGTYLDLVSIYDYVKNKNYQYPSTPCLSLMFAMEYQLNKILKEGIENRCRRHLELANYTRSWADEYFKIFADKRYLSNTLTNIENVRGIDLINLNKSLNEIGYEISNGYGKLKNKTFRIAHMGECTFEDLKDLLTNINYILKL